MPSTRRTFIKQTLAFGAGALASAGGWLAPVDEADARWAADDFSPGPFRETLTRLFGPGKITETGRIGLKLPQIAENGAVVPITVSTTLEQVTALSILVEKNPVPLAARFELSPELEAFVSARFKMAETSDVWVVAETDRGLYGTRQLVKVTIGGCGG
jgi:sulfur-oxidizing protein SoxY